MRERVRMVVPFRQVLTCGCKAQTSDVMLEPELSVILTSLPPYLLSCTEVLERDLFRQILLVAGASLLTAGPSRKLENKRETMSCKKDDCAIPLRDPSKSRRTLIGYYD